MKMKTDFSLFVQHLTVEVIVGHRHVSIVAFSHISHYWRVFISDTSDLYSRPCTLQDVRCSVKGWSTNVCTHAHWFANLGLECCSQ